MDRATRRCVEICDTYSCPAYSSRKSSVQCIRSPSDCVCDQGYQWDEYSSACREIPRCTNNYKCPDYSRRIQGRDCYDSFDGTICATPVCKKKTNGFFSDFPSQIALACLGTAKTRTPKSASRDRRRLLPHRPHRLPVATGAPTTPIEVNGVVGVPVALLVRSLCTIHPCCSTSNISTISSPTDCVCTRGYAKHKYLDRCVWRQSWNN